MVQSIMYHHQEYVMELAHAIKATLFTLLRVLEVRLADRTDRQVGNLDTNLPDFERLGCRRQVMWIIKIADQMLQHVKQRVIFRECYLGNLINEGLLAGERHELLLVDCYETSTAAESSYKMFLWSRRSPRPLCSDRRQVGMVFYFRNRRC